MATAQRPVRSALAEAFQSASLPVILILAAVMVGLAALLPLVQSSGATSTAGDIHRLEQDRDDWRARVTAKELEVARQGSLSRIEQEAMRRLGMVPPKETQYLAVDAPLPEPRRLPSRYLPPAKEQEPDDSSLLEDLFGWIPKP